MGWSSNFNNVSWCALDGVGGYYFPGGATNLQAAFVASTGSWSQINSSDSTQPYTDDYLKLWFNSGLNPTNANYAYVLLPYLNASSVSNYALNPDIVVLTNPATLQAVRKPALGVVAANFWTNGNNSADLIAVNSKASVITWESASGLKVGVCDPTQTNTGSITLTLNRSASSLQSADAGVTVVQLSPQIVLSVNVNGSKGKSFQAALDYTNPILPIITAVYPNGTNLFESTNTLAFGVASTAGVSPNNIQVVLNGLLVTNLVCTGSATNWNVSYPHLQPNTTYTVVITVRDANGNLSTSTKSFDTFSAANYHWEAEDFDYNGGQFIDNPQTNAYAGRGAVTNIDAHQVNFAGVYLYRTSGMDTEINGDIIRPQYLGTGYSDYSIGYFSPGAWVNYTRHYPAGSYNVYARLATGGNATTCTLSQVTGGWGTTNQTATVLGTFSVVKTAYESYNCVPLQDSLGRLVTFTFNGATNTLRLNRPGTATADCNANFLMLVPVFALSASQSGTQLFLSFPTQAGFNYQVQYKDNLTDAVWTPLCGNLAGNDAVQSITESITHNRRFYRVTLQ